MKNTTLFVLAVLVIVIVGFLFFRHNSIAQPSGNVVASQGEVQKITLSMKNGNYYPNTVTVKVNQPVEITLDNSIAGCYRGFNIRDFGVSKYSSNPNDKITFTPNKKGSFRFACSMGMGTGTLIVE